MITKYKDKYITKSATPSQVDKKWFLVNAEGLHLGRLASKVAKIIRGKHKAYFTPHMDCGDNVVVINAEKIELSGRKWDQKEYVRHTGFPGGRRVRSAREMLEKYPTRMVEKAVKGMLPKNKLGRSIFKNLYVYSGDSHKHGAQTPKLLKIDDIK